MSRFHTYQIPAKDPRPERVGGLTDAEWRAMCKPWDPERPYERPFGVQVKSFHAWCHRMLPQLKELKLRPIAGYPDHVTGKGGHPIGRNMLLYLRRMPSYAMTQAAVHSFTLGKPHWDKTRLVLTRGAKEYGTAFFDDAVILPILCKRDHDRQPWMSITPNEIMTMRPGWRKARGRVLIGGLGMGVLARLCLAKPTVKSLDVVERDEAVANFFGTELVKGQFEQDISIDYDDVWRYLSRRGRAAKYDTILLDVWEGISDASWDERLTKLRVDTKHPRIWAWGEYAIRD